MADRYSFATSNLIGKRLSSQGVPHNKATHTGDGSRPRGCQLHTVWCEKNSKLTNLMKISRIEGYNGK